MDKLLLLSVILVAVIGPVYAAQQPQPARALRRTVVLVLIYNLFYVFAIIYIWPRLVV